MLGRLPVVLLGLAIAISAAQASCGGVVDTETGIESTGDAGEPDVDAAPGDASEDSPDDRADGMSYGDGYGR